MMYRYVYKHNYIRISVMHYKVVTEFKKLWGKTIAEVAISDDLRQLMNEPEPERGSPHKTISFVDYHLNNNSCLLDNFIESISILTSENSMKNYTIIQHDNLYFLQKDGDNLIIKKEDLFPIVCVIIKGYESKSMTTNQLHNNVFVELCSYISKQQIFSYYPTSII